MPVTAECRFCIFIQGTPTAPPKWNGMESSEHCGCLRSRFPSPARCWELRPLRFLARQWDGDIASESETGRKKIYADISTARCTHT